MRSVSSAGRGSRGGFQRILDAFLMVPGLPFSGVLDAERIEAVFRKHGGLFGQGGIYNTAVMVWSFLGQVLRDGKEASCQAAVARITAWRLQHGALPPTADTGDYCRARAKLSEQALRELTTEVAQNMEEQADPQWLWKGRHAKLIDGSTFTMPDTVKNQKQYPQPAHQAAGVGQPIGRFVAVLSLATACVMDASLGPYTGKQTGETALLRRLFGCFRAGDVAVADRYYCGFMMMALLCLRGVDVCARMHQKRHVDFRRGRRLGKYDHLILWTRPQRPEWMDEEFYESIPETLTLRELRFSVNTPGYRTNSITIATTLTDTTLYTKDDIAELYGFRWHSELDLRAIKQSLNLAHLRCRSPEMVRREFRTTLLACNLIRTTAAAAACRHHKLPRQISFTATCQYVLSTWPLAGTEVLDGPLLHSHCRMLLALIAEREVANRPGRIEPRVLKRRRHGYPLMQQPRHILRANLNKP